MIPQMKARGYGADYAVNVTSMAALIALLLPPSHNMIIYSISAGGKISIADLFTAGVVPGLLFAAVLMVTAYIVCPQARLSDRAVPGFAAVLHLLAIALPGLLLIAIIFGGVRSGIFTATESSCIAVIYALLVTLLIYRQLSWQDFVHATMGAVRTTAMCCSSSAARPPSPGSWPSCACRPRWSPGCRPCRQSDHDPAPLNVLMLVLGTFMDMGPTIIITTPIFLPIATAYVSTPSISA